MGEVISAIDLSIDGSTWEDMFDRPITREVDLASSISLATTVWLTNNAATNQTSGSTKLLTLDNSVQQRRTSLFYVPISVALPQKLTFDFRLILIRTRKTSKTQNHLYISLYLYLLARSTSFCINRSRYSLGREQFPDFTVDVWVINLKSIGEVQDLFGNTLGTQPLLLCSKARIVGN